MPILSFSSQPDSGSLNAAYRPIIISAIATRTGGAPVPPVVFCDIYFNGVFYKSLFKTQPTVINDDNSEWQFDISDAAQEYLSGLISEAGEPAINTAPSSIKTVFCRFRSSGFNDNFIVVEGTEPVQGTGSTPPVAGDGEETNTFYILNVALQHEDNQDLAAHLASYRWMTWSEDAWPLTHRPSPYKICPGDHDMFPIVYTGGNDLTCIRTYVKYKGANDFVNVGSQCFCSPIGVPEFELPEAVVGELFTFSFDVTGTAPITIPSSTLPGWLSVSISGKTITLSGTPTEFDVGEDVELVVQISNDCDEVTVNMTVDVFENIEVCLEVSITASYLQLPHAAVNVAYNHTIPVRGDAPIMIDNIVKPSWMTINLTGNTLTFSGTPTEEDEDVTVSFTLSNCIDDTFEFSSTFDVLAEPAPPLPKLFIVNNCPGAATIDDVKPSFYIVLSGGFPLNYTDGLSGTHGGYSGPIEVETSGVWNYIVLWRNNVIVQQNSYPNNILNSLSGIPFVPEDQMEITLI